MNARPKLLDLFCGAGGAAMGYHLAGFDVVGVDINPQPHYPFPFNRADALSILDAMLYAPDESPWLLQFDAIHASPPCQHYSSMRVMANAGSHPDLVAPTRERLEETGLPWVIENVIGAPLEIHPPSLLDSRNGVVLCGTMFGLHNGTHELRRHRLFEANFPLPQPDCRHRFPVIGFYGDHARYYISGNRAKGLYGAGDITGNERKMPLVRDLMGIEWMSWDEARLAIPPAFTRWVGQQLLSSIEAAA